MKMTTMVPTIQPATLTRRLFRDGSWNGATCGDGLAHRRAWGVEIEVKMSAVALIESSPRFSRSGP